MKTPISIFVISTMCMLAVSCKSDSPSTPDPGPDPNPNPNIVSEDIGPDGGSITSNDGLLTLTIPAGALGNVETITIAPLAAEELGSEFDQLVDAEGIAEVYELGPDGLVFDQPVAVNFGSEQTPLQTNDTLNVFSEFMFTSSNGTLELLDSLQTVVDFDDGTVTVQGQLSHFSPLVTTQANSGVSFFILDVPDKLEIGGNFTANASIFFNANEGPLGEIVTVSGPAMYEDRSGAPIISTSSPPSDELMGNAIDGFTGSFDYICNDLGLGVYASDLSVHVNFNFDSGVIQAESFANFITTVECIEEMPSVVNLQIALEGNGSGSISSDPAGIDCPGDCEEEYAEGTRITLTAAPDDGSVFEGWGNEAPADCGMNQQCIIDLSETTNDITATLEKDSPPDGTISKGLFQLPEELFLPGGLFDLGEVFANLSGTALVGISGRLGFAVIDIATGDIVFERTEQEIAKDLVDVVTVTRPNPGSNTPAAIYSYGNGAIASGGELYNYSAGDMVFDEMPTEITTLFNEIPFDAVPAGGGPVSDEIIFNTSRSIDFIRFNQASNTYKHETELQLTRERYRESTFTGIGSAYAETAGGPLLVIVDDNSLQPDTLFFDTRTGDSATAIGGLGETTGARKIRCKIPVCGVLLTDDSAWQPILWDGENQPTIVDKMIPTGLGPSDLDLYRLPNGNTLALTATGFGDNTITLTEVDDDANVISNNTMDVSTEGCRVPKHAIFVPNTQQEDNPNIVVSCFNTNNYFITDLNYFW